MAERKVLGRLLEVYDLPTLPVVVNKVLNATADDSSSATDLTTLLEQDHAISARILRLANSPFYGLRHRVETVRRGVVVLGFNEVRNLALATSVFDTLAKRRQFALDPEDFWMHALGTAKASQFLCRRFCERAFQESCFTAGLLHDIGKYILALVLKEDYVKTVNEAQRTSRPLREVERDLLHMTHTQVGRWVAEKWRFPTLIAHAIAGPERIRSYKGPDRTAVLAVALGDVLSRRAGFGNAGDQETPAWEAELLDLLGLTGQQADALVEELCQYRDETLQFLNLLRQN